MNANNHKPPSESGVTFRPVGPALNTVAAGLELAHRVVAACHRSEPVIIDFAGVERMTPSFANALVMTILEAIGSGAFQAAVRVRGADESVDAAWNAAIDRYQRGIRLSSQRAA